MQPLNPARRASLGMTAVLGIAVALGAGLALFKAHAAPPTALRPESSPQAEAAAPPPAPSEESRSLSGSVLETHPASQYTYLRLATADGQVWAAVPSATVALGSQVTVENAARMTEFKSATLKRTFDVIYFGTLAAAGSEGTGTPGVAPADALAIGDESELPPGHPEIGTSAPGAVGNAERLPAGHPDVGTDAVSPHPLPAGVPSAAVVAVAVSPAHGGNARTIAQLSAQRQALAGRQVRVRGQVTKVTLGVQGRTFFHLRDGETGASGPDLVVTSSATPERGQVATFEGTLRADADLGYGLEYPILLDNATIVRE